MKVAARVAAEDIREYVRRHYLEQARRQKARGFSVNAGEVHKAMGLHNRVPQVCAALDSMKFLKENGLRLVEKTGPPSGLSTSVTLKFAFEEEKRPSALAAFDALRGAGKELFQSLGGGDSFVRSEREAFNRALEERE